MGLKLMKCFQSRWYEVMGIQGKENKSKEARYVRMENGVHKNGSWVL